MTPLSRQQLDAIARVVGGKSAPAATNAPSSSRSGDLANIRTLLASMGGAKDPLAGSKGALDAKVAAIVASNAPESQKKKALQQSSTGKRGESWWERTLNIIGKPKTLVVSAIGSMADPKRNFLKDLRSNVGVGDLLANQEWYKDLPGPAKFGIGLAGDIALDPLTYLAGAGAVSKIGGASGAAKLAFDASAAATAAGSLDDAARFAQIGQKASKGVSLLSSAEKDVVADLARAAGKIGANEKLGGLYWTVPGTGPLLGKVTGLPLTQIPIIKQGATASAIPKAIRTAEEGVRASVVGAKATKYFGGNEVKAALTKLVRRGTPEQANAAFHALDAWNLGGAKMAAYARDMEVARRSLVDIANKSGVNMEDITRGLGGDLAAAERVNKAVVSTTGKSGFMDSVRAFDNAVIDEAHRLVGRNFVTRMENHAPTLRGPGVGTEGVAYGGGRSGFDPAGFEYNASKAGDTFQGEVLLDPNKTSYGEVVGFSDNGAEITRHIPEEEVAAASAEGRIIREFDPDPLGRDVKSQREAIVKNLYGEDAKAMYNMNWDQASAAQVRGMSNRIRGEVVKGHLREKGVAKDIFEEVLSAGAVSAREMLPGLRAEQAALQMNSLFAGLAREVNARNLVNAQQDLSWVVKESADNVARARQMSERMAEAYGGFDETVQRMFDEAAAAGREVDEASLNRAFAELWNQGSGIPADSPMMENILKPWQDLAKKSADEALTAEARAESLRKSIAEAQAAFKAVDDTYRANLKAAERLDDLIQQKAALTRKAEEIQGIFPEPTPRRGVDMGEPVGKIEDVVVRSQDPLATTGRTTRSLRNSSADTLGSAAREGQVGRLALTREGNIVADYDSLKAALDDFNAGIGTASDVRSAAKTLNKSLREAGLPTVPAGTAPERIGAAADRILGEADIIRKQPIGKSLNKSEKMRLRKINKELKKIDTELSDIEKLQAETNLEKLASDHFLLQDTLETWGQQLDAVTTRAESARAAESANRLRIEEIRNQTAGRWAKDRSDLVQQKIDAEIAAREKVSRLREEALAAEDKIRVTKEQVQAADDAALEAELVQSIAVDEATAATARLEAIHLQSEADLARIVRRQEKLESKIGRLASKENETIFKRTIEDGFARLDMRTQAPDVIADALMQMTKLKEPGEIGRMLKTFDMATSLFKSYAILTPGFHVRNFIGGMFNNHLAGVTMGSYRKFLQADKIFSETFARTADRELALRAVGRQMGAKHMEAYRVVDASAALRTSGQIGSTAGDIGVGTIGMGSGRGMRRLKSAVKAKGSSNVVIDNPLTRVNYMASERVERTLRGTLAYDVALKGGDEFQALDNVYKFHFNYDDLSDIEQRYMKRISPFYTWSRKNVPLQVEMLFQKPATYARIGFLKDNIEKLSPTDDLVPNWFYGVGGIRMPFTNPSGERLYMMPDLPPLDLRKVVNPQEWLGEINPVLKVPFELQFNKQLYNQQEFREGYVPFPESWNKIGLGFFTDLVGLSKIDANGQRVAKDSTLYALESYLPPLNRARRLAPSEDKYQRRVVATWASMLFGLGFRANTEADKKGELYRRSKNVEKINTGLETLGYGGYKTLSRDIATTRAPAEGEKSPFLMVAEPKGGLPFGSAYTMPTKGLTGQQALNRAISRLESQGASQGLLDIARRVSEGRQK